ncbi:MAG: response regulator [Chloroflexi bacterium]|nr:response regulator [Chloroflexota bacterium]
MPPRPAALILHADSTSRRTLADVLDLLGLQVVEASSGLQGLALARQIHPDLVFLGNALPDGTTAETIRGLRASGTGPPIVLLLQAHPDAVILEPVAPDQVQQLVGQLLEGH